MDEGKIQSVRVGNRYEKQEILGSGTYGEVWLATDTTNGTKVALKFLLSQTAYKNELLKEVAPQVNLDHDNITEVFGVDFNEGFIVLEYVEGAPLDEILKHFINDKQWIDYNTANKYFSECLNAISYLHANGVIHGDIKPGNIIINTEGNVKITDFGVAKIINEREYNTGYDKYEAKTRKLGSISYIAPEVLEGKPRNIRSDIFSLGLLGYLLFTGRHPFYPTDSSGLFTIKELLLSPNEAIPLRMHLESIPETTEKVILKMLSKDPDQRYIDVNAAIEEFRDQRIICPKCGAKNEISMDYCGKCTTALKKSEPSKVSDQHLEELWRQAYNYNYLAKYTEAESLCSEIIKINPVFWKAYQTHGFALSGVAKYSEARMAYEIALKHTDNRRQIAQIHKGISYTYQMEHNKEKAIEHLEIAVATDPTFIKAKELLDKYKQYSMPLKPPSGT